MSRLLFILALLFSATALSQYDMDEAKDTSDQKDSKVNPYEIKKRIYVGGDLQLSFGNATYLYLAPMAGYEIWGGISGGVSTMYQLLKFSGTSQSYHSYGGGIFFRWRPPPLQFLLLQTEFNVYNTDDLTSPYLGDRVNVPAVMSGLGYAGGFGKAYYQIMLMWDFVDDINNPLPRLFGSNIPLYLRYGMVFYLG
ncbi:MAG: hypothetical protein R2780_07175 [Crocinitomicaceae bacterium]|nr:hypothetical protein [Crocinitomicaceae bacterium]